MRTALLFAALSAMALAGCGGVQAARMAMPDTLAFKAVTVPVSGISGGRSGQFRVGEFSGRYTRSDSRLAVFDPLFERRGGRTNFELTGPGIVGSIRVACHAQERSVTLGVISFEAQPMTLGCDIDAADSDRGRLEVRAHREGVGGRLMRQERRGEISIDGATLHIRSAHDLVGSGIQLATPIGYIFEQDGASVGAVEINGSPVVSFDPAVSAATRQAILIASVTFSLFWDPAESALGREGE